LNVFGAATISGAGSITLQGLLDFTLVSGTNQAKNSLTTGNQVDFGSTALVKMNFDPTGLTCDRIVCSKAIDLSSHPALSLNLINDQPLNLGTKFLLIDYRDYKGEFTIFDGKYSRFNGYTNHQIFTLGLNTYQMNYADDTYLPDSQQFLTLTVVPNPVLGVLNVKQQGTNAALFWEASTTNLVLEATALFPPAPTPINWTPVPVPPVLIGDWFWVTVPIEPDNRFFRLRRP
jgi:hypothetical protein